MVNILLWILVFLLNGLSIYLIVRSLIFSFSLFQEVPFVSTEGYMAKRAMNLLDIKAGDRFVDPGCGNGDLVFKASQRAGGEGEFVGVELNSALIFWANLFKLLKRDTHNVRFVKEDLFSHDYRGYNKVFLFLTTDFTQRLMKKLKKELPKGARVVSSVFSMGDSFIKENNVKIIEFEEKDKIVKFYVWDKK